jgi:glycosyltransferase involved in cell wall biosynthesis
MRLLLVADAYLPTLKSVAVQMHDLAAELASQGHAPVVITLSEQLERPWQLSREGEVEILRVRGGATKSLGLSRIGLIRRALSEVAFSWLLWRAFKASPLSARVFDGVVWYSPSIFLGPFAAKIKARYDCASYLILRDIFPQWSLEAGIMRRGAAYAFLRAVERFQYRVADVIGVQARGNLHYFDAAGAQPHPRVEVLQNWVRARPPESTDAQSGSSLRVLVYGGTMGPAQDMDNILRLAANLRDERDVQILLLGGGTDVPRLRAMVAERGLTNVRFAAEKPPAEFQSDISRCYAGLITLDRRLTSHNIPGKLLSYLQAGIPVVASVNPGNDIKEIVEQAGAGIVLWNGDDGGFREAALQILRNPELREAMSRNAVRLCRELFAASVAASQIVTALESSAVAPARLRANSA